MIFAIILTFVRSRASRFNFFLMQVERDFTTMGVAVDDVFLTTKGTEVTKCEPDEIAFPRPAHSGSPLHLLPPEAILHLPIKIQNSTIVTRQSLCRSFAPPFGGKVGPASRQPLPALSPFKILHLPFAFVRVVRGSISSSRRWKENFDNG
jgi:hypothetical protein